MTEYFEIDGRGGPARRGHLRLAVPVPTPGLVDEVRRDAGSLWTEDRPVQTGDDSHLTILPHRAFPAGTPEPVASAFDPDVPDLDAPSAAVVAPETAGDRGTDAYVLSTAPGIVDHGVALVDAVVTVREAIPDDATPIDDLRELPCACPACAGGIETFDREACADHNERALRAQLRRVRERIRRGRLRDYLEGQVRHDNELTAALRELDDSWGYVEPRTPVFRNAEIAAATGDTLRRPAVRRFADRVTSRYRRRLDGPLVVVPCSAAKPYAESQSHGQFRGAIDYRGHKVSLSSPVGVVPLELETTYPAQHYDTVVTGRWTDDEVAFVGDALDRYLDRADYDRIVAHVADGGYRRVVDRATADRDIPVEYTVTDHPTTDESLSGLSTALDGEDRYSRREREHATVRAVADYQFGPGAGDDLFPEVRTEARMPKLRVMTPDGEQLAALVPEYGLLALTLAGARRWVGSPVPTRTVEIDDFVPHGSVLAPGIVDADDAIRPGDEVVVEGPSAFGVGRARAHGAALREGTRGVGVSVRHVEER
ncbi:tRNA-ribosyltransferase [Halobacteriales archaeon SW_7_68_16]|nr:MAG: tRNA-ribosyltransferase [Halobacteriales archaeon SW_7_68_16]